MRGLRLGLGLSAGGGAAPPFSISFTGLSTDSLGTYGQVGNHAAIGYTITPDLTTETVKWSNSSNPADAATFGTGASPTDFTSVDGFSVYLHVTDDPVDDPDVGPVTRSFSFPVRYAPGTASAIADGQTFTVDSAITPINAAASGANLTFSYALTGGPAGLSINSGTGEITGTPTAPASSGTATITATDQYGRTYSDTFTYTASLRTQATAAGALGPYNWTVDDTTVNVNAATDFTANGNTLTYSATGLPAGVTINSAGTISGTPTAASSGSIVITATDEYGRLTTSTTSHTTALRAQATGGTDLDLSFVQDVAISSTNLVANWTANGNTLTLVSVSPALPTGLSINSAGTMTGTPADVTADATYTLTMQDEYGRQTSDTFTLEITDVPAFADFTFIPMYGQSLSLGNDPNVSEIVTLDAAQNITGATQANPVVITCVGHGYSEGDTVYISGVGGMTQLNGFSFEVLNPTADTFELYSHDGTVPSATSVNGTAYGAYTSGGTVARSTPSATHKMFNGGIRVHYDDPSVSNVNTNVAGDTMTSLLPLTERMDHGDQDYGETMAAGMLSKVTRPCITATLARGAYSVSSLSRSTSDGRIHYTNLVQSAVQAKEKATGTTFAVGPVIWKQGEQDGFSSTARATWKSSVQTLRSDLQNSFLTAAELDTLTLPLMSDQQAVSGAGYASIAVGLIELHREDANIYCVGPSYWHDYYTAANDVHLTATGYRVVGEFWGNALESILAGNGWEPCHITATPTRSGTTITVPVHVPFPPLVKDTSLVAAATNDGFTYSGATITAVTITDDGTGDNNGVIEITINSAAGGTLGYAYNNGVANNLGATTGARGNIRDSSSATATFNGANLYNWLCVDQFTVS